MRLEGGQKMKEGRVDLVWRPQTLPRQSVNVQHVMFEQDTLAGPNVFPCSEESNSAVPFSSTFILSIDIDL